MNRDVSQSNVLHSDPQIATRQRWMGVLARAGADLATYESVLKEVDYRLIRAPEIGMTLVRGRMGGTGSPFNLGEMSVTRCVVRLADGRTGYSYLAALADAHLQGSEQAHWQQRLIEPLAAAQRAQQAAKAAETATTQVEFFTLVRGED
jgi:alpha-D-ribose 1-methylphosphonate 5-triphosphate synthase subunit PhnG